MARIRIHIRALPDFFIFPNPTHDYLVIQGLEMMQFTRYAVSDLTGKTVLSGELAPNQFKPSRIDMTTLSRGLFVVKLSGNAINRVFKVVKE
jgi:hypothetical protein